MEPITDKLQEILPRTKSNANIIRVAYTILTNATEAGIEEYWCILYN